MYVPSNPHEAYKMGVKDATEPLSSTIDARTDWNRYFFNQQMRDRRKSLLTKKVTKWALVYCGPSVADPARQYFGSALLCDTEEEEADRCKEDHQIGPYPIEIETEI